MRLCLVVAIIGLLACVGCGGTSGSVSPDARAGADASAGGQGGPDAGSLAQDGAPAPDARVGRDAAGAPDAPLAPDAASGPDAPLAPDATSSPDATLAPDATSGPDATLAPDATSGPDATPASDAHPSPDASPPDAGAEPCGNGVLDPGEKCDTAIAAGMPGACPTECDDLDLCTDDALVGTGCQARCAYTPSAPVDGDGICCPPATDTTDDDCVDTAFRFVELELEDPHVWTDLLGSCADQTALVNNAIANALSGFDVNLVIRFRPLDDQAGDMTPADFMVATCDAGGCAPGSTTQSSSITNSEANQTAACLDVIAGTDGGYGSIVTPPPSCFAGGFDTVAITIPTIFGDLDLSLEDVEIGATYDPGNDRLIHGLLRGFLPDDTASSTTYLGSPLSSYLAGGSGNCSSADDHDQRGPGDGGWYFYLTFTAEKTPFSP